MSSTSERDQASLVKALGSAANRRVRAAAQAESATAQLRAVVGTTARAGVPISTIIGTSGLNRSTIYTWLHRDTPELFTNDDEGDSKDDA